MLKPLIKICGIRDAYLAALSGKTGVHYIGIVFHSSSKRFVEVSEARQISAAARLANAIPVAVFVDHTADVMQSICEMTNITHVQLHGSLSRKEHHLLSEHYRRFYVQAVSSDGELLKDTENGLQYCKPDRDYILYDHVDSGKGKRFDWNRFHPNTSFKYFIAGGLSANNVGLAIKQLRLSGIDVSSGVENDLGQKDIGLIREFVSVVNEVRDEK